MSLSKPISFLIICFFVSGLAHSSSYGCRLGKDDSITTEECSNQLLNSIDVELNEKYQQILTSLKTASASSPYLINARNQLIASQRSWIKFRDSDCRALSAYLPSDPSNQSRHSVCLMERTKQRVIELEEWVRLLPQPTDLAPYIYMVEAGKAVAGQPLSVWIQRYWQWQRSFPAGKQPSTDNMGSMCGIRQNQDVFFLSGSAGSSPIARRCTIPANKHILVPIINVLAQNDGSTIINCDTYLRVVREVNESATDLSIKLNNLTIGRDFMSKAESGCFHLTDATRGVSGSAAGAGYWMILEPLKPGRYSLRFTGKYLSDGYSQDVSYQIDVE